MYGPGIPLNALKHKEVSSTTHARLSYFFCFKIRNIIFLITYLYAVKAFSLAISKAFPCNSGTIKKNDEKKYNQHLMHLSQNPHLRFIRIL